MSETVGYANGYRIVARELLGEWRVIVSAHGRVAWAGATTWIHVEDALEAGREWANRQQPNKQTEDE